MHNALYSHQIDIAKESKDFKKLFYIYQHFQDSEKIHQIDTDSDVLTAQEDSLYSYVNNDIDYGLLEDIVDSTVELLYGQEMTYFDARSKGLVQINNSKHFPIDQYLHDRMTPATLSPSPLAYEKPIHPTEMPCITTRTEIPIDDTNKSTPDDKYP